MIHIFKIKKFKLNFKFSHVEVNTPPLLNLKSYMQKENLLIKYLIFQHNEIFTQK